MTTALLAWTVAALCVAPVWPAYRFVVRACGRPTPLDRPEEFP